MIQLMGILNVTPDSFSDGGRFLKSAPAVERALEMEAQGAHIIDMGAESTRPGSRPVSARTQLQRLLPVLRAFRSRSGTPVSIDTQSAEVAEACLGEGAQIINDISALRHDRAMAPLLARSSSRIVMMHMQGTPRTMQKNPRYNDVISDIEAFFKERIKACRKAGIDPGRMILDPGIGFGKTAEHNLTILRRLDELLTLNRPLLVGVSRKGFLGKITGEASAERRVSSSIAAGIIAASKGASILRVHDVAEHAAALRVFDAIESK